MINEYENASLEVLKLIYKHKYMQLSAVNMDSKAFSEEPPQDKSQLVKKLNNMDVLLTKLSGVKIWG